MSLAAAFVANKLGLDVLDFRGGESQYRAARAGNFMEFLAAAGAKTETKETWRKPASETAKIIQGLPVGKTFYFVAGKHAAIVRNTSNGPEYLELQSHTKSGWRSFTEGGLSVAATVNQRFGSTKGTRTVAGFPVKGKVRYADITTFSATPEFRDIMGYINTPAGEQRKGAKGGIK